MTAGRDKNAEPLRLLRYKKLQLVSRWRVGLSCHVRQRSFKSCTLRSDRREITIVRNAHNRDGKLFDELWEDVHTRDVIWKFKGKKLLVVVVELDLDLIQNVDTPNSYSHAF